MTRPSDCLTADGRQKFTFFDKAEAKRIQRHTSDRSAYKASSRMHVYHCPHCGHYHLGHEGGAA